MSENESFGVRARRWRKSRDFVFWDFVILGAAFLLFFAAWFGITRGSNIFVSGSFYSEGFTATYELEGVTALELGGKKLTVEVVEADGETATLEIMAGGRKSRVVVDRETAKVLEDTQTGVPLIFYYDITRMPQETSKTFGDDTEPEFSTEFTGLKGEVRAFIKEHGPDNVVMWYHRSDDRSYGPQFSWEVPLYDRDNVQVATIVNDVTSGLLLDARFHQNGYGAMNLTRTDYPTGMNRWAVFYGLNSILFLWGIFHLLRCRKHREEWEKHWSYFPLKFVGVSRFAIRLFAFTTFGFLGAGVLTGNPYLLVILDLIGLALMVYAVGAFAFPVVFQFIGWIAAFGVFAGGRYMDYVQYPFGVLLYLTAVLAYELHNYKCHKKISELKGE